MKRVEFELGQSGGEWHSWRSAGIGASDISVIMGSNPYKTPYQLWEEKCGYGKETVLNDAMKHGIRNEHKARTWLNRQNQLNLQPLCIEDEEFSFMKASLDGYDDNLKVMAEIKCPISEKTLNRAAFQQAVHNYWYDQVLWQIMLAKPQRAFIALWDYRHETCITIEIAANKERINEMREKAKEFWHCVKLGKPPAMQKGDYKEIEDPQLALWLEEYLEADEKEKAHKALKNDLKDKIVSFGEDHSFMSCGFKITKVGPRAYLNKEQMELDGIDLEKYTEIKEGCSFRISRMT